MNCKAVIFDLFGTLIDMWPDSAYEENMRRMSDALGAPAGEFRRVWMEIAPDRNTGRFGSLESDIVEVCRRVGLTPQGGAVADAERVRFSIIRENLTPRTDALPTLQALKSRGLKIGLLSDAGCEVPEAWPKSEFAGVFDAVAFSCELGAGKPDPATYAAICGRLGVAPEHCIYVGDGGSSELTGALSAGLHPVLIRVGYDSDWDHRRADALKWTGPTIGSLSEVLRLIP